jgi:hypothetical protein
VSDRNVTLSTESTVVNPRRPGVDCHVGSFEGHPCTFSLHHLLPGPEHILESRHHQVLVAESDLDRRRRWPAIRHLFRDRVPIYVALSNIDSGQNGCMDLESATQELYGLAPAQFTAARNAKVIEARKAGFSDVAASLKELRKPSTGAWLANLLVRERSKEIENLVELGDSLRVPQSTRGGDQIRKVTKEKVDAASKLIRHAKSRASQLSHPASTSAIEELETTLDAAFADPQAAARLRQGRLTSGLLYSGLGFIAQTQSGSPSRPKASKGSASAQGSRSVADRASMKRDLDKAIREAEQADAHLQKTRQAVAAAADELVRLRSDETLAVRRSKEAHAKASAAKKRASKLR